MGSLRPRRYFVGGVNGLRTQFQRPRRSVFHGFFDIGGRHLPAVGP